jgi:hypothetical protein
MNTSETKTLQITQRPVFIVRFWWEPGTRTTDATISPNPAGEWRGSVEVLLSGKQYFFRSLNSLTEIIAAQLGNYE